MTGAGPLSLSGSFCLITLFKRGERWGDKENICVRKLHFKRQLKTGINKSAFMEAFLHVVKHFSKHCKNYRVSR